RRQAPHRHRDRQHPDRAHRALARRSRRGMGARPVDRRGVPLGLRARRLHDPARRRGRRPAPALASDPRRRRAGARGPARPHAQRLHHRRRDDARHERPGGVPLLFPALVTRDLRRDPAQGARLRGARRARAGRLDRRADRDGRRLPRAALAAIARPPGPLLDLRALSDTARRRHHRLGSLPMTRAFTIVMAGGSGTRFWPLSRAHRPKQLLPLAGGTEPLLASTVRRATRVSAPEDVLVVTSERLSAATRAVLPGLPAENVLAEPIGRNTAPCIGWAASRIARVDPDAVCAVLPADHHIADEDEYARVLSVALDAAAHGDIVTVGIRPSRPETGYGYIEMGEPLGPEAHRARRFVEKPNRQRAEQFLAAGTFLWNS